MTTKQILESAAKQRNVPGHLFASARNAALGFIADYLESSMSDILAANKQDLDNFSSTMSDVMVDRLRLDEGRIKAMADGVRAVAALPDPVGEIIETHTRPDGLEISKVRVPLGVIAIIYESRPNVTSDAAALCLKSGNVCVLRAGKEAHATASAIVAAMRKAIKKVGFPEDFINLIEDTSRESANELMNAVRYVDLLIPRGGAGLIKACVENAKVPVIQTGTGICHIFVDSSADFDMALSIIENAKCSRPSVCNAMEVCLVHADIAKQFLPLLYKRLVTDRDINKVILKLDERACKILGGQPFCERAGEYDFDTEFLDYKMAVAVVDDDIQAVNHIAAHSTGHSDCIVTSNESIASRFVMDVDSAAVYVNASTRFTDGGEFGLGCEMGISTQKLHARGPMGLKELTTYKYVVRGNGNIR